MPVTTILMSHYLRPERFDAEPSSPGTELRWVHWLHTFKNFLSEQGSDLTDSMMLKLLINHLSPAVFAHVRGCDEYNAALKLLDSVYIKPKNEVHSRHVLSSRKQQPGETIDEYILVLKQLAHDCNFKNATAEEYKNEYIRDALIAGIRNYRIRQRLLENKTLTLDEACNQAVTFETAENHGQAFNNRTYFHLNTVEISAKKDDAQSTGSTQMSRRHCFFCGSTTLHKRTKCPAYNALCQFCSKKGHFANVCRSNDISPNKDAVSTEDDELYPIPATASASLTKAIVPVMINNSKADALIDTGSSSSFINEKLAFVLNLKTKPIKRIVTLASADHKYYVEKVCNATITLKEHVYKRRPLLIVNNLCADLIIGRDILKQHSSLSFHFGGPGRPLEVGNVTRSPASISSRNHDQLNSLVCCTASTYERILHYPWRFQSGKLQGRHINEDSADFRAKGECHVFRKRIK